MTENFIQPFMMLTTFISLDLKKFKITLKYLKKYLSCCYSYLFNGLVTIRNPPIIKCNQLQKYSFHFFFICYHPNKSCFWAWYSPSSLLFALSHNFFNVILLVLKNCYCTKVSNKASGPHDWYHSLQKG